MSGDQPDSNVRLAIEMSNNNEQDAPVVVREEINIWKLIMKYWGMIRVIMFAIGLIILLVVLILPKHEDQEKTAKAVGEILYKLATISDFPHAMAINYHGSNSKNISDTTRPGESRGY